MQGVTEFVCIQMRVIVRAYCTRLNALILSSCFLGLFVHCVTLAGQAGWSIQFMCTRAHSLFPFLPRSVYMAVRVNHSCIACQHSRGQYLIMHLPRLQHHNGCNQTLWHSITESLHVCRHQTHTQRDTRTGP